MKNKTIWAMLATGLLLIGCYFPEIVETRIVFSDSQTPVVMINYQNISSGAENEKELRESFDDLVKDFYGDQFLVDRASEGLAVRKRQLVIKNEQLHAEITGDADDMTRLYNFYESNEERFLFYDGDDSFELVETNGRIIKTERNTLIVWPIAMQEIYWKEKLADIDNDAESKRLYRNVPKMVALFKEYQSQKEN